MVKWKGELFQRRSVQKRGMVKGKGESSMKTAKSIYVGHGVGERGNYCNGRGYKSQAWQKEKENRYNGRKHIKNSVEQLKRERKRAKVIQINDYGK